MNHASIISGSVQKLFVQVTQKVFTNEVFFNFNVLTLMFRHTLKLLVVS